MKIRYIMLRTWIRKCVWKSEITWFYLQALVSSYTLRRSIGWGFFGLIFLFACLVGFFCLVLKKDDAVILKDFASFAWSAFIRTERSIREVIYHSPNAILQGIYNQLVLCGKGGELESCRLQVANTLIVLWRTMQNKEL